MARRTGYVDRYATSGNGGKRDRAYVRRPGRGGHQHEQGHTEDRKGHFLHRGQRSSWHQKSFHGKFSLFSCQTAEIWIHKQYLLGLPRNENLGVRNESLRQTSSRQLLSCRGSRTRPSYALARRGSILIQRQKPECARVSSLFAVTKSAAA